MYSFEQVIVLVAIGIACVAMPTMPLFVVSLVGTLLADTRLVSSDLIYLGRFVPLGVLSFRVIASFILRKTSKSGQFGMVKTWLPFLLLALISTTYSPDPSMTLQRALSAVFAIIGFGMGVPLYFKSPQKIRRLIMMIFLLMGGLVLYSLLTASSGASAVFDSTEIDRLYGVFRNPNTLGLVAMQTIFLSIYLVRTTKKRITRNILLFMTIGVGVALVLSGSRASVLGFLVGMLVFVWSDTKVRGSRYRTAFIVMLIAGSMFLIAGYFYPEFFGNLFRYDSSGRQVLMKNDWEISQDAPYFGVGFGGSDEIYLERARYLRSLGIYAPGSHSSPMKLLVDLGFCGVLLAVYGFFVLFRRTIRLLYRFEDPQLGVLLLSFVAASLVNSFFESWVFGFGNSITLPFWLCVSILAFQCDTVRLRMKLEKRERFLNDVRRNVPVAVSSTVQHR